MEAKATEAVPTKIAVVIPESSSFHETESLAHYINAIFLLIYHCNFLQIKDFTIYAIDDLRKVLNENFKTLFTVQLENQVFFYHKNKINDLFKLVNYQPKDETSDGQEYIIKSITEFAKKPSIFSILYLFGHVSQDFYFEEYNISYQEILSTLNNKSSDNLLIFNDTSNAHLLTQYFFAFNTSKTCSVPYNILQTINNLCKENDIVIEFDKLHEITKTFNSIDVSEVLKEMNEPNFQQLIDNSFSLFHEVRRFSTFEEITKSRIYCIIKAEYEAEHNNSLNYLCKYLKLSDIFFDNTEPLKAEDLFKVIDFMTRIQLNKVKYAKYIKDIATLLRRLRDSDIHKTKENVMNFLKEVKSIPKISTTHIDFQRNSKIEENVFKFLEIYEPPQKMKIATVSSSFSLGKPMYYTPLTIFGREKCMGTPFISKLVKTFHAFVNRSHETLLFDFLQELSNSFNETNQKSFNQTFSFTDSSIRPDMMVSLLPRYSDIKKAMEFENFGILDTLSGHYTSKFDDEFLKGLVSLGFYRATIDFEYNSPNKI